MRQAAELDGPHQRVADGAAFGHACFHCQVRVLVDLDPDRVAGAQPVVGAGAGACSRRLGGLDGARPLGRPGRQGGHGQSQDQGSHGSNQRLMFLSLVEKLRLRARQRQIVSLAVRPNTLAR